jgi:hypothetical protein
MKARFPGTCAGCGRRYGAGAELVRAAVGWVGACCAAPAPEPSAGPFAGRAEILDVLARARVVAARVAPAEARRAGRAA